MQSTHYFKLNKDVGLTLKGASLFQRTCTVDYSLNIYCTCQTNYHLDIFAQVIKKQDQSNINLIQISKELTALVCLSTENSNGFEI